MNYAKISVQFLSIKLEVKFDQYHIIISSSLQLLSRIISFTLRKALKKIIPDRLDLSIQP